MLRLLAGLGEGAPQVVAQLAQLLKGKVVRVVDYPASATCAHQESKTAKFGQNLQTLVQSLTRNAWQQAHLQLGPEDGLALLLAAAPLGRQRVVVLLLQLLQLKGKTQC
jgi:hypothetical protein